MTHPAAAPTDTSGPGIAPAALRAVGAAVLGAGIWIGLAGPLNVTWGLVAVAIFVGWLVGSETRTGARFRGPRRPRPGESLQ